MVERFYILSGAMAEHADGAYVWHSDYEELLAENERLRNDLAEAQKLLHQHVPGRRLGCVCPECVRDELAEVPQSYTRCPQCGGPTEFDRSVPPNPYLCDKCDRKSSQDSAANATSSTNEVEESCD